MKKGVIGIFGREILYNQYGQLFLKSRFMTRKTITFYRYIIREI